MQLAATTIDGANVGPHLLITGGVHGDEFEPMAAIRKIIDQIDPQSLQGRLTLIPVVNQSAFARQHRCGEDGLDLARICPGDAEGSITEQAAAALSQLIHEADYYIDLHTGGTCYTIFPLVGYTLHPEELVLEKQRQMALAFNLPIVWGTTSSLEGRTLSVARDARTPAIYAEYLGSAECSQEGIEAYFNGCLNVMRYLGMIDRVQPASCLEHHVENDRPESGHLQIQNPSPIDGYFSAEVSLGQVVVEGDLLGLVCDDLGKQRMEIRAACSGIVLMLRTFPAVRSGESVAVVLEINSSDEESS